MCVTLNEFPYIRYYVPINHPPLGPLGTNPSAAISPPPIHRAPPSKIEKSNSNNAAWRTNLARGSEARAVEAIETEYVTKILAFMVQSNLDEYKRNNSDFGVRFFFFFFLGTRKLILKGVFIRKVMGQDREGR